MNKQYRGSIKNFFELGRYSIIDIPVPISGIVDVSSGDASALACHRWSDNKYVQPELWSDYCDYETMLVHSDYRIIVFNPQNINNSNNFLFNKIICTKCKKAKKQSDFHRNSNHKSGLESWCKLCVSKVKKKKCLNKRFRQKRVIGEFKTCAFNLQPDIASFIEGLRPIIEGL